MIQRGSRDFVIDLADCELMDSTFMGTMAGIALRLREMGSGNLFVLHSNARNQQLLENLGLDHLFSFELPDGIPDFRPPSRKQQRLDGAPVDSDEQRQAILSAHEALVEADPENEARFHDVLELLKNEKSENGADF